MLVFTSMPEKILVSYIQRHYKNISNIVHKNKKLEQQSVYQHYNGQRIVTIQQENCRTAMENGTLYGNNKEQIIAT